MLEDKDVQYSVGVGLARSHVNTYRVHHTFAHSHTTDISHLMNCWWQLVGKEIAVGYRSNVVQKKKKKKKETERDRGDVGKSGKERFVAL